MLLELLWFFNNLNSYLELATTDNLYIRPLCLLSAEVKNIELILIATLSGTFVFHKGSDYHVRNSALKPNPSTFGRRWWEYRSPNLTWLLSDKFSLDWFGLWETGRLTVLEAISRQTACRMPFLPSSQGDNKKSHPNSQDSQLSLANRRDSPLSPAAAIFVTFLLGSAATAGSIQLYKRYAKRIRNSAWITPKHLSKKRWIKGVVTRYVDRSFRENRSVDCFVSV